MPQLGRAECARLYSEVKFDRSKFWPEQNWKAMVRCTETMQIRAGCRCSLSFFVLQYCPAIYGAVEIQHRRKNAEKILRYRRQIPGRSFGAGGESCRAMAVYGGGSGAGAAGGGDKMPSVCVLWLMSANHKKICARPTKCRKNIEIFINIC